ncbi:MAG: tRNA pseudouridine(55) synthase TruB [Betaproteobacteria bacterium]|nr:tRNA pseudouridine(55) synthase TruB [Betaproteobacteria bacterium]
MLGTLRYPDRASVGDNTTRIRRAARRVNGVLLLDKPVGITSNAALKRAKTLFGAAKAGHTGTLDPLASGLLPVCLGEATKFSNLLLGADKTYEADVRLGVTTTTGDLEGEIIRTVALAVERAEVEHVVRQFVGEIRQVPPMFSAIKYHGKPLYRYARAGREVPRRARVVSVSEIVVCSFGGDLLRIIVRCSKGTYMRVLAEDIGRALGCGACVARLRRTAVGHLDLGPLSVSLSRLEAMSAEERQDSLMPPDALAGTLPGVTLEPSQTRRILAGQAVKSEAMQRCGLVRLYGGERGFLGIGEITGDGEIVPRRLVADLRPSAPIT